MAQNHNQNSEELDIFRNLSLGPQIEAELFVSIEKNRSTGWSDGKPHIQELSWEKGLCIRVLKSGSLGLCTSRTANPSRLDDLYKKALTVAETLPPDEYRRMGHPGRSYPSPFPVDDSLFQDKTSDILDRLRTIENRLLSADKKLKKVVRLIYQESSSSRSLINSHDLNLSDRSSSAGYLIELLAEDKGRTEVSWDYVSSRFSRNLDFDKIAENTVLEAIQALGGKPLATGFYPIVIHPRVGTQFLNLIAEALSADAIQSGRSFFRGLLNQSVAAPLLTMIDDPLNPNGLESAAFDDEGTPHQICPIVVDGVLKDYFYDIYSAGKDKRETNGHGMKESLGSLPQPSPTNFYIKPGLTSFDELTHSHKKVFLVRDVMGLHMVDPVTGEFSLGASGSLYENGAFSHAVRGVTLAGTFSELLKKVIGVGIDLTWYGSRGTPSLLISSLSVGGA